MIRIKIAAFAILAAFLGMVGLYAAGRRAGEKAIEHDQLRRAEKAMKEARDVADEINAMPDSAVDDGLRRWTRD